jgi:hypothetical protein
MIKILRAEVVGNHVVPLLSQCCVYDWGNRMFYRLY